MNGEIARILTVGEFSAVHVGGAERYRYETVRRLQEQGLVVMDLFANGGGAVLVKPPWRLLSGGYHPGWPSQIDRILRDRRPDIIYAHLTVPGLVDVVVWRASLARIPVCLVYHSDVTGEDWARKLMGEIYYHLIGCRTLRCVTTLIVSCPDYLSSSPRLAKLKGIPVYFAPPGVDPQMVMGRSRTGPHYVLFVGKADSESKGFEQLYLAWQDLRREFPYIGLKVVGPVPSSKYPGVGFVGRIDDRQQLADCYASALVTVLPSVTTESFGMVLAEALVAGCPVIGTRIGGIPSIVSPDENGYLVAPRDVNDLYGALRRVICHRDRLRAKILSDQESNLQNFSWDLTTERVWAALRATAATRGAPGD